MKNTLSFFLLIALCLSQLAACSTKHNARQVIKNTNHLDNRAHKYLGTVRKAANKYNVDASLILAIIHTESSFNPYAISGSNALGLMQIMPDSAGADVFSHIKNRRGKPTRRYLLDPQKNVDTGTAYLHLLHTVYLAKITNPITRRYAAISAYNGGIGTVLRTFSVDRQRALFIMNQLTPDQVYQVLLTCHPDAETRRYLHKVNAAHQHYRQGLPKFSKHR